VGNKSIKRPLIRDNNFRYLNNFCEQTALITLRAAERLKRQPRYRNRWHALLPWWRH